MTLKDCVIQYSEARAEAAGYDPASRCALPPLLPLVVARSPLACALVCIRMAEEEAEKKRQLRLAQKAWRDQEEERLAMEAAERRKKKEDMNNFHASVREKVCVCDRRASASRKQPSSLSCSLLLHRAYP